MKYLLPLLFVLGACSKPEKNCAFSGVVDVAAHAFADQYKCNEDRVKEVFMEGLDKVGLCKNVSYAGINMGGLGCMLVPSVVRLGESYGKAYFQCEKDFNLEEAVSKLMKCEK